MRAVVRAEIEAGYDGVQRLLLDLERFGFGLLALKVEQAEPGAEHLILVAHVSGLDAGRAPSLAARFMRHPSVRRALVTSADTVESLAAPMGVRIGEAN